MSVPDQLGILTGRVNDLYTMAQRIEQYRVQEMERIRGRKPIRFRMNGSQAGTFTFMGGDSAVNTSSSTPSIVGPDQGYAWSIRQLVIEGLTTGANQDLMNIRINNAQGPLFWNLTGNSFGSTFGRGELVLFGGESLFFQAGAVFAAVGTAIKVFGLAENLPAERIGEFY